MTPLLIFYCTFMFFPPRFAGAVRLAYVCGSVGACTGVSVDAFPLFFGWMCLVLAAEYVFELCGGCECGVYARFGKRSFELWCNLRDVTDTGEEFVFLF